MAVTKDKPAPYATASSVLDLIMRHRERGMPSPVTAEVLGRCGIPDSLIPRTMQSLETLDLIDEKGAPTKTFEGLRLSPEAEFKHRLAEWLRSTYADIFAIADPSKDDETRIRDAFRNYSPVGQQPRMVTLFLGLSAVAGLVPDMDGPTPKRARATPAPAQRKQSQDSPPRRAPPAAESVPFSADIPAPIAGLLSRLPKEGEAWTSARRDQFLATFGAIIDFCYRVDDGAAAKRSTQHEEDGE